MKKLFTFFALLLFCGATMAEDCFVVVPLSNEEQATAISEIGYLQFIDDNIVLFSFSGSELGRTPLNQVRKILFADTTPTDSEGFHNTEVGIRLYPNPTSDMLIIDGADESQTIRIYSIDGQLIHSQAVMNGRTVLNVATLSQGDYLLQIGGEVVKFIKK